MQSNKTAKIGVVVGCHCRGAICPQCKVLRIHEKLGKVPETNKINTLSDHFLDQCWKEAT